MLLLILSSIVASVVAAPSGAILGPLAPVALPTVPGLPDISAIAAVKTLPAIPTIPLIKTIPILAAIPVATPTISPGDIQAAAINAKVETEDLLRAAVDKSRELTEQVIKGQAEKIVEASNLASEKNQEAFWETEDKKWQALTALQTAQAKIDGLVASNAELIGQAVIAPTGVAPLVYSAVAANAGVKIEENKEVKAEEVKEDSVQIEAADASVKAVNEPFVALKTPAAVVENEKKIDEIKLKDGGIVGQVLGNIGIPLYAPIPGVPINLNEIGWQATLLQPGVKLITPGVTLSQEGLVAVAGRSSW